MPSSEPGKGWVGRLRRAMDESAPEAAAGFPCIPGYRILRLLGEGAVGAVYEAVDERLGRTVAIKVLKDTVRAPEVRVRFMREAQAAARVVHPNVAAIYDVGEADGRLFLVMEVIQGRSLHEAISGMGTADLLALMEKVGRGIGAAHAQGIVHRDLKPGNIMVTPQGEPKIVDFGLAHFQDAQTRMTRTGAVVGTPLYMAPEQIRGRAAISPATDVYALATILYEGLTGRPPFVGQTAMSIFRMIVEDEPEPPRRMRPEVPRDVESVVLKALEKDPARRYSTAAELAAELRRCLDGEPVQARPVSGMHRAWRKLRRSRLAWVAAALLVGLSAGLLVWGFSRRADIRGLVAEAARREQSGALEEALGLYGRALEGDPREPEALAGKRRVESALRDRKALIDGARRDYERSRRVLEEAVLLEPQKMLGHVEPLLPELLKAAHVLDRDAGVHFVLGRVHELLGRYEQAESAFVRAAELDPRDPDPAFRIGRLRIIRGFLATITFPGGEQRGLEEARRHSHEAERWFGRTLDLSPTLGSRRRALAEAFAAYARRDPDTVNRIAKDALSAAPDGDGAEDFYWVMAICQTAAPHEEYLTRAIVPGPMKPIVLFSRGHRRSARGEFDRAREDFDQALAYQPGFFWARVGRGLLEQRSGRPEAAISDFTRALKAQPRHPELLYQRALAYRDLHRGEDAIADLNALLEIRPGDLGAMCTRSRTWAAMGDMAKAIADAEAALSAAVAGSPEEKEARELLAELRGQ